MIGAIALLALGIAGPSAPAVKLGAIEARFYYNDRGQWSDNMLDKANHFGGWNSIIGEGDSGGPLDDVMIDISLSAPAAADAVNVDKPLEIRAVAGGKVIARRTNANLLIPYHGKAHVALFLVNVACKGRIDVTASFAGQVRKAQLDMDCGE